MDEKKIKKQEYDRQRRIDNHDEILQKEKIHRQENKEMIAFKNRNYYYKTLEERCKYIECSCGRKYQLCKKARHFKSKFHINNSN